MAKYDEIMGLFVIHLLIFRQFVYRYGRIFTLLLAVRLLSELRKRRMGFFRRNRDAYDDKARSKVISRLGLRLATDQESMGEYAELRDRVSSLAVAGKLEEFDGIYGWAWESRAKIPDGRPLYSMLISWATGIHAPSELDQMQEYLDPFARRYRMAPSPTTGALYAQALMHLAGLERGAAWAHQTEPSQWAGFAAALSSANAVLDETRDVATESYIWHEVEYQMSFFTGGARGALDEAMERAWSLDRNNLALIAMHVEFLLPRWAGVDEQDADVFARRAAELTAEEFGAGAYSMCYLALANYPQVEAGDTAVDPALVHRGFKDLQERYGCVRTENNFARTMSWLDQEQVVKDIFDGGLKFIDHGSWQGDSPSGSLEAAVRAYMYARDSV